ncbi:MAG: valine--pyruvate transaminase [Spirochaetaceae bacterium]|nr:MAG: valine--pyruvate transaminase [Spirochaetaceae bacterium]
MRLSRFGEKLTTESGILALMDDLGKALAGDRKKYMLGGGNPAHIPQMNALWRDRMQRILDTPGAFERMLSNYDPPQGNPAFIEALARLLNRRLGWPVEPGNIAVTNGSQTSFFLLFNMLGGTRSDGSHGRILFPMMPEYIGYADQAIDPAVFTAHRPVIEELDRHTFKYHVDLQAIAVDADIAALCVSRPTNPTGNVLTDEELTYLDAIARQAEVPLIIDNAYGVPFPGMIFEPATPLWNENIIVAMSLSKLGLPATRTGIIIAASEVINAVTACNAVLSLANGSIGQTVVTPLLESGEILRASEQIIRPYYQRKSQQAIGWIREAFSSDIDYRVHRCEGSLFLWVWFRNLPVSTLELYRRLKRRNTIVVPGRYFFFGLDQPWEHQDQCIRLNYAMDDSDVRMGIGLIADEVRRVQAERVGEDRNSTL